MKKTVCSIIFMFSMFNVFSQQYDPRPNYPKYEGYRSLDYYQDTVRYLKYNWGLEAAGVYSGEKLSLFFDRFELPIYDIELFLVPRGNRTELSMITLFLLPKNQLEKMELNTQFDINKYVLIIMTELPEGDSNRRMTYDELAPYFSGLQREGETVLPWQNAYEKILGSCQLRDIQYNFEVEGQPF